MANEKAVSMDSIMVDIANGYKTKWEGNDLFNLMSLTDPAIVTSQVRNLGYSADPEFDAERNPRWDVIYNVVIVVRDNPALYKTASDEELTAINQKLFATAAERVWLWYRTAVDVWEGKEEPTVQTLKHQMPDRPGAPNVTIYGSIMDKAGRTISLTVTDQSQPDTIYKFIRQQMWLYDYATKVSLGVDFNGFAKTPYRQIAVGDDIKSNKPKKAPKATKEEEIPLGSVKAVGSGMPPMPTKKASSPKV